MADIYLDVWLDGEQDPIITKESEQYVTISQSMPSGVPSATLNIHFSRKRADFLLRLGYLLSQPYEENSVVKSCDA